MRRERISTLSMFDITFDQLEQKFYRTLVQ